MAVDAWLPIGFKTPDGEQTRIALYDGPDWQIYSTAGGGRILVARASLAKRWFDAGIVDDHFLSGFAFGDEELLEVSCGSDHQLAPVFSTESPQNSGQAVAFAESFKATRAIDASTPLHDAIYVEKLSRLLPTYSLSSAIGDDVVFGTWLTSGVPVSIKAFRRVRSLTTWMSAPLLADIIARGGFQVEEAGLGSRMEEKEPGEAGTDSPRPPKTRFALAGRPYLETFFNEHVIDIVENQERYAKLGIDFPSAIIMHGPPGCGKTFAIERLIDYLGWPSFQVDASSVASPYIHETSKKVSEIFENAIKNAPSVLVIDEMEAFLADRESGGSHHRVEEVAEFLRRIPEAVKNRVLIVAMTNRINMIDPAIMRRGRFDHVLKVDYASEEEVRSLLDNLLAPLPKDDTVSSKALAKKLESRPLSDVAYVVREGSRLAVRAGQDTLNQECLLKALEGSPSRDPDATERRIGFV